MHVHVGLHVRWELLACACSRGDRCDTLLGEKGGCRSAIRYRSIAGFKFRGNAEKGRHCGTQYVVEDLAHVCVHLI